MSKHAVSSEPASLKKRLAHCEKTRLSSEIRDVCGHCFAAEAEVGWFARWLAVGTEGWWLGGRFRR